MIPSLKVCLETASMAKSRSWSRNCPHCMAMWLRVSSGDILELEMSSVETFRALGKR